MTPNPFVLAAALLALSGPATAEVYLARCKMGECIHYEQSGRRVEAQGSAAVPGELVRAGCARRCRPAPRPAPPSCNGGRPPRCASSAAPCGRPIAWRMRLPGPGPGPGLRGAREVSTMYLRACHPSIPGGDIEAALQSLGYRPTPDRTYPSFEALIR
ncbi:hypothetical protein [Paracoccus mutanolyticus]|uniref:hypothetical protein n=1 Tax=Paracoccus mutanolyticus TaxID=1499308 RepID=UPI0011AE734C|nr:hypothetical protein [Paracoccus mutanolyticus]